MHGDGFRNTAQDHAIKATAAVRADDNEVGLPIFRSRENSIRGSVPGFGNFGLDGETTGLQKGNGFFDGFTSVIFAGFDDFGEMVLNEERIIPDHDGIFRTRNDFELRTRWPGVGHDGL